jgi:hypothetical protein
LKETNENINIKERAEKNPPRLSFIKENNDDAHDQDVA